MHFGSVAEVLEGDEAPLPYAGIFEFPTLDQALAFYHSEKYAPIKAERQLAQQARCSSSRQAERVIDPCRERSPV